MIEGVEVLLASEGGCYLRAARGHGHLASVAGAGASSAPTSERVTSACSLRKGHLSSRCKAIAASEDWWTSDSARIAGYRARAVAS